MNKQIEILQQLEIEKKQQMEMMRQMANQKNQQVSSPVKKGSSNRKLLSSAKCNEVFCTKDSVTFLENQRVLSTTA